MDTKYGYELGVHFYTQGIIDQFFTSTFLYPFAPIKLRPKLHFDRNFFLGRSKSYPEVQKLMRTQK